MEPGTQGEGPPPDADEPDPEGNGSAPKLEERPQPTMQQRRSFKWTKMTDEMKDRYIEALTICGQTHRAAVAIGLSHSTVQRHRQADPEFDEAVREAIEAFADKIESEMFRRSFHGWLEPHFGAFGRDGTVRKYDSALLLALAKRHRKAFVDRMQADVNVGGGVLLVGGPAASLDDLKKRLDEDKDPA